MERAVRGLGSGAFGLRIDLTLSGAHFLNLCLFGLSSYS